MLGIPSLWKHTNRETRNLEASLTRKSILDRKSDPTEDSDSVFMLDIYNLLTDSVMGTEMELTSLSKPALTIRKIRKTGASYLPTSKVKIFFWVFLSNLGGNSSIFRIRSDIEM